MGDGFITIDQLKSFAGQLLVVTAIVQAIKASYPTISTYLLRLSAVLAAIGVNIAMALYLGGGGWLATYLLAPLNGLLVALASMKSVELIKGDKTEP